MNFLRTLFVYLNYFRTLPAWLIIHCCRYSEKGIADVKAYLDHSDFKELTFGLFSFSRLLMEEKSLRNVLLNRLHRNPILYMLFRILFRPMDTLYINMPPENIGGGLSFQHGFSTIIAAEKIGENCRIYQQCTIGYNGKEAPLIEDDCRICCNSCVIGGVILRSGCVVGAGSVVVKDVPKSSVVAGNPAKLIRTEV